MSDFEGLGKPENGREITVPGMGFTERGKEYLVGKQLVGFLCSFFCESVCLRYNRRKKTL